MPEETFNLGIGEKKNISECPYVSDSLELYRTEKFSNNNL